MMRGFAIGVIVILFLLALFTLFQNPERPTTAVSFSQFISELDKGRVRRVMMQDAHIVITFADNMTATTSAPNYPALVQRLLEKNVEIMVRPPEQTPWQISLLVSWLPFLLWVGVMFWIGRALTAPDGRRIAEIMSESTSQSKQLNERIERMMSDYDQRLSALEKKQQP
jgi:cell division protease FtsH